MTLLRLLEPQSGSIELDGIDIGRVKLDRLRQRCFIVVSQDPLLLAHETLRFNLDPSTSVSVELLIAALTTAGLWSHFCEGTAYAGVESGTVLNLLGIGEHPILDQKVSLLQELSLGQCQLFAVCRALIKASWLRGAGVMPVILLDEVTSSLDIATESAIHRIIDTEFTGRGHTVIIVAHRLGLLAEQMKHGRDAVATMADGRVREVMEHWEQGAFAMPRADGITL